MPLLTWAIQITLGCYALAILLCLLRLYLGPAAQDRILAADLVYNIAMLTILVLGIWYASSMYFGVALLISLLGFITTLAMTKFLLRGEVIE